jgi:hypothetical protein
MAARRSEIGLSAGMWPTQFGFGEAILLGTRTAVEFEYYRKKCPNSRVL